MYSHGDRRALIALAALAEPGGVTFAELLDTHTPSEALAIATRETADGYINVRVAETCQGVGVNALVDKILTDTEACGARIVVTGDDEWPQALGNLSSLVDPDDVHTRPPLCLWVRGPHDLAEAMET